MDHITPKKFQLFEEYHEIFNETLLFTTLLKETELEMISDGNKITGVEQIDNEKT